MPRSPRIEYDGAVYHVMSRGLKRDDIYYCAADRKMFMETLEEAVDRTGWVIHAYVLMSNHYHLLVETPEANLSVGMQWLQGTYAKRFKARHRLMGPVFNNRFKSLVIQGDDPDYFRRVADYIHLNPARAKLLSMSHPVLARHPWSSFPSYVGLKRKRPQWLECRRVLEGYPRVGDTVQGRERYRKEMESRAQECMKGEVEEEQELWQACRRGWYLGDEQFRSFLEEHLDGVFSSHRRSSYHGEPARRHDEREAERLLQESLVILRIDEAALKSMSQRDARKQGLAWILKCHTVMSNAWISDRLHMGSRTNIFMAVKAYEADRAKQDIAECRSRLRRTLVNI